jgi:hypothetical protein
LLEHAFEAWRLWSSQVPKEYRVFERDGWRCTVLGVRRGREPRVAYASGDRLAS